jgi:uncharacterized membrane protein
MTQARNPLVDRYLQRFRENLKGALQWERDECAREIESHIAEAVASGESALDVLERLGPAERLARAYSLEMALKSRSGNPFLKWGAVLGVVLTASIPSMVVLPLLLVLGVGFVAGGIAAIGVAVFPFAELYEMPGELPGGLERLLVTLIGSGLVVSGLLALWILYLYVLLIVRAVRGTMRLGS